MEVDIYIPGEEPQIESYWALRITEYYKRLDEHLTEITKKDFICGDCYKCCRYPYCYMSLYEPEFRLIQEYIETKQLPFRVRFEPLKRDAPDKRIFYRDWVCPLYSKSYGGCSVYPVRPFACRIYGPYKGVHGEIEGCVYDDPILFEIAEDLPIWHEYLTMLNHYGFPTRGYIYPESLLYKAPTIEFLLETELPWSYSTNYIKEGSLRKYNPLAIDQVGKGFVMRFGTDINV